MYDEFVQNDAPVDVDVDYTYDASTRKIAVTVNAKFAADLNGTYRFNAVITEDNVTGTSSGYAQTNYYAGGAYGPMGGYENLASKVPAADMVYDHVARAILGTFNGWPNSIPSTTITSGETFSHTFTYTVPSSQNPDNINVVGWVSDFTTGEILNADEGFLWEATGLRENNNQASLSIFPNPSNGMFNISLKGFSTDVNIKVANIAGQIVQSKSHNITPNRINQLDLENLDSGIYFVTVSDKNSEITSKVIVK